jgi:hypothetical protein
MLLRRPPESALHRAVRVVNQPARRASVPNRHQQSVAGELAAEWSVMLQPTMSRVAIPQRRQGPAALLELLDRLTLVLGGEPALTPLLHRPFPMLANPTEKRIYSYASRLRDAVSIFPHGAPRALEESGPCRQDDLRCPAKRWANAAKVRAGLAAGMNGNTETSQAYRLS